MPFSVSLALPRGYKVSAKENQLASFSPPLSASLFFHSFHLIGMEFDVVMKQFKRNILRLLFITKLGMHSVIIIIIIIIIIVIVVVVVVVMIIIIAFKGGNRDFFFFFFYSLLTAPQIVSNT